MDKKDENYDVKQTDKKQEKAPAATADATNISVEEFARFLKQFRLNETDDSDKIDELKRELNERLAGKTALSVAFPECSELMLSLIKSADTDEITGFFKDYFEFRRHSVIAPDVNLLNLLDPGLITCSGTQTSIRNDFPPVWCLPPTCVEIAGARHLYKVGGDSLLVKRLFVADLVWLFYFDRMGIFKILGAILDDYAIKGKLPISNGSVNASDKDDLITVILESMTRKTKMGLSSTVRDRNISYRRALGWVLEEGRKLQLESVVNTAFTNLFHKFIQISLEFYKDKRLATAITGISSTVGKTSVATLTSIKDTIDLLRRTFDSFDYGRNYNNTLTGIVWVIAGMVLVREMRTTLGIPAEYNEADKFIPAAYDILVAKTSITPSETNRYDVHRDCAENARDILLDLEVIDIENTTPGGNLELWLDIIEGKIEGYRTAYRSLTGVDLGASGTPVVEQQV